MCLKKLGHDDPHMHIGRACTLMLPDNIFKKDGAWSVACLDNDNAQMFQKMTITT